MTDENDELEQIKYTIHAIVPAQFVGHGFVAQYLFKRSKRIYSR